MNRICLLVAAILIAGGADARPKDPELVLGKNEYCRIVYSEPQSQKMADRDIRHYSMMEKRILGWADTRLRQHTEKVKEWIQHLQNEQVARDLRTASLSRDHVQASYDRDWKRIMVLKPLYDERIDRYERLKTKYAKYQHLFRRLDSEMYVTQYYNSNDNLVLFRDKHPEITELANIISETAKIRIDIMTAFQYFKQNAHSMVRRDEITGARKNADTRLRESWRDFLKFRNWARAYAHYCHEQVVSLRKTRRTFHYVYRDSKDPYGINTTKFGFPEFDEFDSSLNLYDRYALSTTGMPNAELYKYEREYFAELVRARLTFVMGCTGYFSAAHKRHLRSMDPYVAYDIRGMDNEYTEPMYKAAEKEIQAHIEKLRRIPELEDRPCRGNLSPERRKKRFTQFEYMDQYERVTDVEYVAGTYAILIKFTDASRADFAADLRRHAIVRSIPPYVDYVSPLPFDLTEAHFNAEAKRLGLDVRFYRPAEDLNRLETLKEETVRANAAAVWRANHAAAHQRSGRGSHEWYEKMLGYTDADVAAYARGIDRDTRRAFSRRLNVSPPAGNPDNPVLVQLLQKRAMAYQQKQKLAQRREQNHTEAYQKWKEWETGKRAEIQALRDKLESHGRYASLDDMVSHQTVVKKKIAAIEDEIKRVGTGEHGTVTTTPTDMRPPLAETFEHDDDVTIMYLMNLKIDTTELAMRLWRDANAPGRCPKNVYYYYKKRKSR